jgi:phosphohistidine phosphatase
MEIYLLRHGIAEDGYPDSERALTGEGKEKLRRVLKRAGVKPSLILTSPYRRAVETAEIAAEVLGYSGDIERAQSLTPDGSPADVWEEIRARKNEDAILLASHEPLMSATAAFLLGAPGLRVDMKKAALVRVDVDRFGPQPLGVLKWMLTPAVSS